jgi:hypothetical protein
VNQDQRWALSVHASGDLGAVGGDDPVDSVLVHSSLRRFAARVGRNSVVENGGGHIGIPVRPDDMTLGQEPVRRVGDPVHILPVIGVALTEVLLVEGAEGPAEDPVGRLP